MAIRLIWILSMFIPNAYSVTIRPMQEEDSHTVILLTMQTWQKEYQHILSSDFLDNFPLEVFKKGRQFILAKKECHCLVAISDSGEILGFSDAGKNWQSTLEDKEAEIYAIYVDPNSQRLGIGQALFRRQLETLRTEGYKRLIIWTFEKNYKSRQFYEKLDGQLSDTGEKEVGGIKYASVQYQWKL